MSLTYNTLMIDSDLERKIEREAAVAFEEIASDLLDCPGDAFACDAVEPTIWQMSGSEDLVVRNMAENYSHPDRKQFLQIVQRTVSRYYSKDFQ